MKSIFKRSLFVIAIFILLTGCQTADNNPNSTPTESEETTLSLPSLTAASLDNQPLKVVATTSVIGDIVSRVGGDAIELTILIAPGQDSHSYEPSSGDLTATADAHVIFINGWNLEEGLIADLENVSENGVLAPVSAGIDPLQIEEHEEHEEEGEEHEDEAEHEEEGEHEEHEEGDEHEHSGPDPHTWLDPHLVEQWVENISLVLSSLDPANAEQYRQNAADYLIELQALIQYYDEQVATIPVENRVMVTNHDSFGYFAAAYGFEIIGTVLAGTSTLSEPSAEALAELVETMNEAGVCTIFAETSVNTVLAETVTAELNSCDNVQVVTLYTESIGSPGSGADSYIDMMQANIDAIANGLK